MAGASVVVLAASAFFLAWCFTFFASGLAGAPVSAGAAVGAVAVVAAVAVFAGVVGACANEATAIPDRTVAAISVLIFNMV